VTTEEIVIRYYRHKPAKELAQICGVGIQHIYNLATMNCLTKKLDDTQREELRAIAKRRGISEAARQMSVGYWTAKMICKND